MTNYIKQFFEATNSKYAFIPLIAYNTILIGKVAYDKYNSSIYNTEHKIELVSMYAITIIPINYCIYHYFPQKYLYIVPIMWGSMFLFYKKYFSGKLARLEYQIIYL